MNNMLPQWRHTL